MTTPRERSLSDLMDFDHIVQVHEDGTVTEPDVWLYAPTVTDGKIEWGGDPWSLMGGYTGQQGGGDILHNSEQIGGGLERDILAQPGYYVAVMAHWSPMDGEDPEDYDDIEGWAVAYLEPLSEEPPPAPPYTGGH